MAVTFFGMVPLGWVVYKLLGFLLERAAERFCFRGGIRERFYCSALYGLKAQCLLLSEVWKDALRGWVIFARRCPNCGLREFASE